MTECCSDVSLDSDCEFVEPQSFSFSQKRQTGNLKMMWAKRGQEKRRTKRTRRGVLKEDVTVLFRWRLLKSSVKVETWRVVVVFLGRPLGQD